MREAGATGVAPDAVTPEEDPTGRHGPQACLWLRHRGRRPARRAARSGVAPTAGALRRAPHITALPGSVFSRPVVETTQRITGPSTRRPHLRTSQETTSWEA